MENKMISIAKKGRIKNVLNYKITAFWVIITFTIVLVVICINLIINTSSNVVAKLDKVDLSDIELMNIGSEMPRLLYGDENVAVMEGTFGLLVYNLSDSMVTDRISFDELKKLGIPQWVYAGVSQDGMTIYFGNDGMKRIDSELRFTYQYDIKSNTIKEFTKQDVDVFTPIYISNLDAKDAKEYRKYFDSHYLANDSIVEINDSFMYLRAENDWSMKSLQLVICQYTDSKNKIYNVFKSK